MRSDRVCDHVCVWGYLHAALGQMSLVTLKLTVDGSEITSIMDIKITIDKVS